MRVIKRFIQKILLYLLKKLNMPKLFFQLSLIDLRHISNQINIIGVEYYSLRLDINDEVAVIEYKILTDMHEVLLGNDLNNPDATINIDKDFKIIITGFDDNMKAMIHTLVENYLKQNNFIIVDN